MRLSTISGSCPSRALAALVSTAVLAMPASVLAQSERERQLEARVAELERMVQQLVTRQQVAPAHAPVPVPAPAAMPAADKPIQPTQIASESLRGTTFEYGGFIKFNAMLSDYSTGNPEPGSVSRDFYIPGGIPVGGDDAGTVYDTHAKQSRFWLATNTSQENGSQIGTRVEIDFAVPAGGDERNTNRYAPSLRRAYFTYDNWLFGQEWSNFMDLGGLPDTTDFIGPTEGTIFSRQAQVRYTKGSWSVALENPETTILPNGGGDRIITDDNQFPDLTMRYRTDGGWGNFAVAGVLRRLRIDTAAATGSETGFGVNVTSMLNLGDNDLRFSATYGSGIGRYLGLNFFEDGVINAAGGIDALDAFAGYVAYRHFWSRTLRSNIILGYTRVDNDAALTGLSANAKARSARINLMWSPVADMDLGIEVSKARRELESGASGDLKRVDVMANYNF